MSTHAEVDFDKVMEDIFGVFADTNKLLLKKMYSLMELESASATPILASSEQCGKTDVSQGNALPVSRQAM